jgi:transcriptional regulator with XRE-family HTH domain
MEIKERILLILKNKNLTPSAFADQIGVQRSNISHIISGRNKPSLDLLEKIVIKFPELDVYWLITGHEFQPKIENFQIKDKFLDSFTVEKANQLNKRKLTKIVEFYDDQTVVIYRVNAE